MPQHTDTRTEPVWSNPSAYEVDGVVHHGYSTANAVLMEAEASLGPVPGIVVSAWYAKLDPGGFIVPHIDQGPWVERWHYPISGLEYVWQRWVEDRFTVQDGLTVVALPSKPYQMIHHQPHAVWNPYDEPRIVLIVEYDNPVDQPTTDLILCPMIPEVQAMINAV